MANGWVSNTPVSQARKLNYQADVNLNGVLFSYEIGLMYDPQQPYELITPPSGAFQRRPGSSARSRT